MTSDVKRLSLELTSIISTLCPEVDTIKLEIRLEEVLTNYEIHRKTVTEVEKDIPEKIGLYLASIKLEGLSVNTLSNYKGELRRFSNRYQKINIAN